jgi:hypothetical protein
LGTFALTGQAAGLQRGRVLVASVGTFTLTGQPATFSIGGVKRLRARDFSGPQLAVRDDSQSYW